jgi:nitrate reductase NapAB chaperone NapD
MKIVCLRCGYEAGYLQRLKEHLVRKNTCPAVKRNMTPEEVYSYYSSKINHKNTPPICEYCGKEYPTKNSAFRVHRTRCKKAFEQALISEFSIPQEEPKTPEEHNKVLLAEIAKLKEENEALKKTQLTYNDNSTNNVVVVVNSFGSEDLSHLDSPEFKKKLEKVMKHQMLCWDALPFFIQSLHYKNSKNENLMIKNPNDEWMWFYNGEKWVANLKKKMMTQLVNNNWVRMQDYLEDDIEKNKAYQMVSEKVHYNPKYRSYVQDQISTIVANKGEVNVFNPTGDQGSKQESINEFLIE